MDSTCDLCILFLHTKNRPEQTNMDMDMQAAMHGEAGPHQNIEHYML